MDTDTSALRAQYPVFERLAYLNAGTDGPLAAVAADAATAELHRAARQGRGAEHFERRRELGEQLRGAYAATLGCEPGQVALTTCTSEGLALVIGGLIGAPDGRRAGGERAGGPRAGGEPGLRPGDEILTSDEEHPGLLGALGAARQLHGVRVRMVALERIADEVGPRTRLVACSHVGWMSGSVAPAELAGVDAPVLLDGAQGVGALPVDVRALGCDAYAGAGQKWLCGPDGTGMLYVSPALRARLAIERRGYGTLADPEAGLDASVHEDARALDTMALSAEALACALAAVRVLQRAGWEAVHERARTLARRLAHELDAHGREVAARGATTLVSFCSPDPEAERERLRTAGVILRNIPGRPWLRASVGAWNDEHDLDRLLAGLPKG